MLNIDLHPCQSSVILITFFQILFYTPENFVYSCGYHSRDQSSDKKTDQK